MDVKTKRKQAEAVRRRFSDGVSSLGFLRGKVSFWVRERALWAEFVHLHLFTHSPSFRVHLGIRVLNDASQAPSLNGLSSADGWYDGARKYLFGFSTDPASVLACADQLAQFVQDVALPWFARFGDIDTLLGASDSPLDTDARARLRLAAAGKADESNVRASRRMLGRELDKPH